MKKYIKYIGLALISMSMFSCSKDDSFNYPEGHVGSSVITNYAVFNLKDVADANGNLYTLIKKGEAYVEPGATATEKGQPVELTTSGTVNTNVPGVYPISYSAINSDGFPASAIRNVIVYSTDASAENNDFSGKYFRAATKQNATWTKIAPGVYYVDNPGGAANVTLTVFVFNPTGYNIHIPDQTTGGSETSSSTESTIPGSTPGTLDGFTWKILNPGYGTGLRTFVKQ